MRDKNLLQLFLGLNVALAACFVVYLLLASNNQPTVVPTAFTTPAALTNTTLKVASSGTNAAVASLATNESVNIAPRTNAAVVTNLDVRKPLFTQRKFGWEQIQSDAQTKTNEYLTYLDSLRAVGCPEDKIRYIVLTDINELFSKKRLKEAVTYDVKWWRSEMEMSVTGVLQEKGRGLEEERRVLIERYLGAEAVEAEKGEAMLWSSVQLTGPVLGNLPTETHNQVQEICARSIERSSGIQWARFNNNQAPNAVDMAQLRERTRADLRKVLNAEGMEEFLLRYSQNSKLLRDELRSFEPTADEFRKIFQATDQMDHQLQLEYGGVETLSPLQRERHVAQREAAIKEVLEPARFQDYLLHKDHLYGLAKLTATQFGAPPKAVMAIYQVTKTNELRRQNILNDTALAPQQKTDALTALKQEEIRKIQQVVSDSKKR